MNLLRPGRLLCDVPAHRITLIARQKAKFITYCTNFLTGIVEVALSGNLSTSSNRRSYVRRPIITRFARLGHLFRGRSAMLDAGRSLACSLRRRIAARSHQTCLLHDRPSSVRATPGLATTGSSTSRDHLRNARSIHPLEGTAEDPAWQSPIDRLVDETDLGPAPRPERCSVSPRRCADVCSLLSHAPAPLLIPPFAIRAVRAGRASRPRSAVRRSPADCFDSKRTSSAVADCARTSDRRYCASAGRLIGRADRATANFAARKIASAFLKAVKHRVSLA